MHRLVRLLAQYSVPVQPRLLSTLQLKSILTPAGTARQESTETPAQTKRKSKADAILAAAVDAEGPTSDDFYETAATELSEEEIYAKRNKSGLRPYHQRQVNGEIAHTEPCLWTHHTVKYKKKIYARYGEKKSGLNPGIQWPTHDELERRLEYERVAYPFTVQEMMANIKERRRLEQKEYQDRANEVETKMKTVGKLIQEVLDKKATKEQEILKTQERKAKLVEEVRRHFGYTVDPKDERFQQMIEKKEKEEKKKQKEARKQEKQEKLLEKLKSAGKEEAKDKVKAEKKEKQEKQEKEAED